jgi:hypothetical protein
MPDYFQSVHKFEKASQFTDAYTALVCRVPQLQPIAQAFIRNMNRVRGLGSLSINLMSVAMVNECARMQALFNKKINPDDPRIIFGHAHYDDALFSEVNEERKRLIDNWIKAYPTKEAFEVSIAAKTTYNMNIILDENKEEGWSAIQATMAAMLIGLWTAFESMAQDAWINAVNTCPSPLADNVMSAPDSALKAGNQSKSLSYSHFISSGFDFRRSMGNLLFSEKKVDFQQLKSIRAAYKVAFASELEPIFEQHDTELFRLETVRNLFVHKGGIIDRKFIQRMGNEPDFQDTLEKPLYVHGEYVATKAKMVAACSTQLIQAIDKWLLDNSPVEDQSA